MENDFFAQILKEFHFYIACKEIANIGGKLTGALRGVSVFYLGMSLALCQHQKLQKSCLFLQIVILPLKQTKNVMSAEILVWSDDNF